MNKSIKMNDVRVGKCKIIILNILFKGIKDELVVPAYMMNKEVIISGKSPCLLKYFPWEG